jgi:hypothetical protein
MSAPVDLWLAGVDLGSLLDDDGLLDETRTKAAIDAVLPTWKRPAYRLTAGSERPHQRLGAGLTWSRGILAG